MGGKSLLEDLLESAPLLGVNANCWRDDGLDQDPLVQPNKKVTQKSKKSSSIKLYNMLDLKEISIEIEIPCKLHMDKNKG